jgi:hypothetical protein
MTLILKEIEASPDAERLQRLMSSVLLQNKVYGFFRAIFLWVLLTIALLSGIVVLEYCFHFESWVRALGLVLLLTISSLAFILLFKPVNRSSLTATQLALQMEGIDPQLKDSLASAIYFLDQSKSIEGASAELVVKSIGDAFDKVMLADVFFKVHVRWVGVSFLVSGAFSVAMLLVFLGYMPFSGVALARVIFPFENIAWPTLTQIEMVAPKPKVGKNETLRIAARIKGKIPKQATVLIDCDGALHSKLIADIQTNEGNVSELTGKIDVSAIGRDFTLQIFAGDAASDVYQIRVLAPPVFLDTDGNPSPTVTCLPPFYAGLPSPLKVSPGTLQFDVPLGSNVVFKGIADRSLKSARLEFQPENKDILPGVVSSLLSSSDRWAALILLPVAKAVFAETSIPLDTMNTGFSISFAPVASGIYSVVIEDESDLYAIRSFDLQVRADPSPLVKIDSSLVGGGYLQLFPDAEVALKVTAEDVLYGLNNLGVEFRGARDALKASVVDFWNQALFDKNGVRAKPVNNLVLERVVKLKDLKNTDGSSFKAGDRFSFRFVASDHDDILPLKPRGGSEWVEIQIVDRNGIELLLEKAQEKARQELLKVRDVQRKATKDTQFALSEIKSKEIGIQKAMEAVQSAEQGQKNVGERLGEKESGILGGLEKMKKLAEANKLKSSTSLSRLNELGKEIKKIEEGDLAQAELQLSEASKRLESADAGKELEKEKLTAALEKSLNKQQDIEKSLEGLLKNLEPWAGLTEMRSDARETLLELEELKRKLEDNQKQDPSASGKKIDELTPMQKEKIEGLSLQQNKVAQKAQNLIDKMNKSSEEKKGIDESIAKNIKDALELPDVKDLKNNLRSAREEIESNRMTEASKSQSKAVEGVREILEKLEENPREMNQKLAKKLREVQNQLEEMKQEMQTLRKKRNEAQKIKNDAQKKEALGRNNAEMEKLASKMEEMAKTLSRLKNENESGNLEDSAKELRRITQEPQGNPDLNPEFNPLDKVQEKLQREIQDVQQLAKETEEKLQRERLEKIAESIKLLSERQEALLKESERFDLLLNEKGAWTRAQILSLTGFARSQTGLAEETELVASRDLDGLPVFMKTIGMAGRSMRNAAKLSERNARTQTKGPPLSEKVVPAQKEALQRLMQFQNALKDEIGQIASAAKDDEPEEKQAKNAGEGKPTQAGGGVQDRKPSSIAQLKLLRNLQAELYDRTEQLSAKFPDSKKMPEDSRREMLNLQKDQREIGELLEILLEFNRKNTPLGDLQ